MKKAAAALMVLTTLAACAPAGMIPTVENDKLAEILARGTLVIATDAGGRSISGTFAVTVVENGWYTDENTDGCSGYSPVNAPSTNQV